MCKGVVLLIKPICFCLFVRFLFLRSRLRRFVVS